MTEPAGIVAGTTSSSGVGPPVDPAVAAGDDPGGAVGLGEVVERPHRVDDDASGSGGSGYTDSSRCSTWARSPGPIWMPVGADSW